MTVVPTSRRARLAHRRERLGENLVEHFGDRVAQLALDAAAAVGAAQLVVDALALRRHRRRVLLLLQLGDARLELARPLANDRRGTSRSGRAAPLRRRLQPRVLLVDLVDDRLDLASFALVAGPDDGADVLA